MSYKSEVGDTFKRIASIVYGDSSRENYLRSVNPGTTEPITPGTIIKTPSISVKPTTVPSSASSDTVTISVDGNVFNRWTRMSVKQELGNVSTFAFEFDLSLTDKKIRASFKPLEFKEVAIYIGSTLLVQGVIVDVSPEELPTGRVMRVSGYSVVGVLQDCVIPLGVDLEFYEQDIRQIAKTLLEPYNINAVFNTSPGEPFSPYVSATISQTVWSFLSRLCAQRSIVMSSSEDGDLVFESEAEEGIVDALTGGTPPVVSESSVFSPQDVFSSVTGAGAIIIGGTPQSYTVNNPLMGDVFRPDIFEIRDSFGVELELAAKSRAGRMYGRAVNIELTLEGWRTAVGALWRPNTLIRLTAPGISVYEPYDFLIKSVTRFVSADQAFTTKLNNTFPGSFSGRLPERLPWDE